MNLYEFNQAGYSSLSSLTEKEIEAAKYDIINYLVAHPSNYYMMLNHDIRYYTIFIRKTIISTLMAVANEIVDVACTLGTIKSIEINEQSDIIEIWVEHEGTSIMFAVFDYQKGVIEV